MLEQLIQFAELGNQHKIICQTPSGKPVEYQGWIMEIDDDILVINIGYGEKIGKDIRIQFEQLAHAQFFYWDHQAQLWQRFIIKP